MNPGEKFFYKLMEDNEFVELLSCLNNDVWSQYSIEDCKNFVCRLFEIVYRAYPEFGKCDVKFEDLGENGNTANSVRNEIVINTLLLKNHKFDVLSSCMHELRHVYQNNALPLYSKTGEVHQLFDSEDMSELVFNERSASIGTASNYINVREEDDLYFYEYMVQPLEFDAERFACQFIVAYLKGAELSEEDKVECLRTLETFNYALDLFLNGKEDFICFGDIYKLNYLNRAEENNMLYRESNVKYRTFRKMMDNLDSVDEENAVKLLSLYLWCNYSNEDRINLLNRYVSLIGCDVKIEADENCIYLNGKEHYAEDVVEILETIYNKLADQEIAKILKNKNKSNMKKIEKEICLNLSNEKNIISKEKHPFLYYTQPFMLYKNKFVYDRINKAYMMDCLMSENDRKNTFAIYSWYLAKYDTNTVMNKVEVMTGVPFNEYYKNLVNKMSKVKTR